MVRLTGRRRPSGALAAAQFLTRVPIRLRSEPEMGSAVPWFPVIGAAIGAAVGGAAAGLWHVLPPLVAGAVAILAGVLITGAFHEDGLADVADAFGGGWTVERRLQILKDPRHGSYGVAALCGSVVVRVASLGSMPGPAAMFAGSVAANAVGRSAAVALMTTVRSAAPAGLGFDYGQALRRGPAGLGLLVGVGLGTVAVGWWIGPVVVAATLGTAAVGALALRKVGGIGGDVLGTAEQIAECLSLVVVSGLAPRYHLWWTR